MLTEEKRTGYSSIDKPWMKYYNESARNITIPQTTIYRFILENNKDYINDTALIYFGKQISYETMYHNIDKIADILTSKGLVKGDSILICSSQTPETVYLLLACSKIGICVVNSTQKVKVYKYNFGKEGGEIWQLTFWITKTE